MSCLWYILLRWREPQVKSILTMKSRYILKTYFSIFSDPPPAGGGLFPAGGGAAQIISFPVPPKKSPPPPGRKIPLPLLCIHTILFSFRKKRQNWFEWIKNLIYIKRRKQIIFKTFFYVLVLNNLKIVL